MRIKISKVKWLRFGKFGREAENISRILSEAKGKSNEERAFHIVENYLRILIREEVDGWKSKFRLKKLENIEFSAGRYDNDPGRDIWIKLLFPEDLRGERIDFEVKSSKTGVKEHKKKFSTPVVMVNEKIPDQKIARRIFNLLREQIRMRRKSLEGQT
jgi:hypothetical protein